MKEKALFILSMFICALMDPYQYCSGQESSRDSGVIAHFGKRLSSDIKKDYLHGSISTAIIKNGKVIWAGAFGYATRDKDIAADTSTIYRIGSITVSGIGRKSHIRTSLMRVRISCIES
jgi:CubicO group peptidase (beta-lactamase class C family)